MLTEDQKIQIENYITGKSDIKPEETPEALEYGKFIQEREIFKMFSKVCKKSTGGIT